MAPVVRWRYLPLELGPGGPPGLAVEWSNNGKLPFVNERA